jgi:hypothetical protein
MQLPLAPPQRCHGLPIFALAKAQGISVRDLAPPAWPDQQILQEATPTCLARSCTSTPDSNAPHGRPRDSEKQTVMTVDCLHFGCDSLPILVPVPTARSFKPFIAGELTGLLAKTLPLTGEGKYRTSLRLAGGCCAR